MKYLGLFLIFISFHSFANEKKTYDLHWGINLEPLDFYIPAAQIFKREVEKRTAGHVHVKLSIGHYLQEERNHLGDVVSGKYDMGQESVDNLMKIDPSLELWDLPFLFKTNEQVFRFTSSKEGKNIFKTLNKEGVVGVEYTYSGGFLHIYGKKISSIWDLKGKLVAHEAFSNHYQKGLIEVLGLNFGRYGDNPEDPKYSEIISSTLNEIYDQENINSKTLNRTEHRVFTRIIFISKKFLDSLPSEFREIVLEEAKKAAIYERKMAVEETEKYVAELKRRGMSINVWSEEQKLEGRKAFDKMYQRYEAKYGKDIIKKIDSLY